MSRKKRTYIKTLSFCLLISFSTGGCSKLEKDSSLDEGGSGSGTTIGGGNGSAGTNEKAYCSSVLTFTESVTVSGAAEFEARKVVSNGSTSGLGNVGAPEPIRNAEIEVLDANGDVVQCSETDASGNFSVAVPKTNGTYTLHINSRGDNTYVKVSILNNPTDDKVHSISKSYTIDSSSSTNIDLGTLTASATGSIEGGAFNIFQQIWKSNDFLRSQTANCSQYSCTTFTVAPKVIVYWSKGVNPATYFQINSPISFYVPENKALYILGGLDGDVDTVDTDHFDNSIIIHEYGHFIEHQYAGTDSPGGSHDGNSVIDPRLAWGEGWANFFQAAVSGNPVYQDTIGNVDGSTMFFFNENIESPQNDQPQKIGEGNFREFSVSRAFWDLIDPHPVSSEGTNESGSDNATISFSLLWAVFTGETNGFRSPNTHFRNLGLFYERLMILDNSQNDISSVTAAEKQREDRTDYAKSISTGTCSDIALTPAVDGGTFATSDLMANNDFYHFTHSGGELTLKLTYTQTNASDPTDLDLYLYKEGYTYGNTDDISGVSDRFYNASPSSEQEESGVETVSLPSLAAGEYMINVKVFTTQNVGQTVNYNLTSNGSQICP